MMLTAEVPLKRILGEHFTKTFSSCNNFGPNSVNKLTENTPIISTLIENSMIPVIFMPSIVCLLRLSSVFPLASVVNYRLLFVVAGGNQ